MFVEEKLKNCSYNLNQIIHFNPDPYYVDYFFRMYIQSVSDFYDGIFEEANRDFGLFISGKSTREKFEKKAIEKGDVLALKFLSWFKENYENKIISINNTDDVQVSSSVNKLTKILKEKNATLIHGHDPKQWQTIKIIPECYS